MKKMNLFTHHANDVLDAYLAEATDCRFIGGEVRIRIYIQLKRSNELYKLFESGGTLDLNNEHVHKLFEHYIISHEGTIGGSDENNMRIVYNALKDGGNLHLLFEEHYSFETESLL